MDINNRQKIEKVSNKCSFIAINLNTNKKTSFNIDALENPIQQQYVGKTVNSVFEIPKAKIKYRIIEILPSGMARDKLNKESISNKENLDYLAPNSKPQKLIDKLKEYGFEGVVHTTEIENFKSIIKCGYLYSRNSLKKQELKFKDVANIGVLDKTNELVKSCCRFYYYYNTPTNETADYKNPIIIVFEEKIIDSEKRVFFTPKNACYGNLTSSFDKALEFDWEGIFERGKYSLSKFFNPVDVEGSKHKISAVRNAELLIHDKVSIKYIKKIIVKDIQTLHELRSFCDEAIMKKVIVKR